MVLDLPGREQKDAIWRMAMAGYGLDAEQRKPDDAQWTGAEIQACCRLAALLDRDRGGPATAGAVVAALLADVADFAAGAEPADDITVLALRWNGPIAGPGPGQVGR